MDTNSSVNIAPNVVLSAANNGKAFSEAGSSVKFSSDNKPSKISTKQNNIDQNSSAKEKISLNKQSGVLADEQFNVVNEAFSAESRKKADEMAKRFENLINQARGTEIKFHVDKEVEGGSFNFAVVDSETGEIIRKFPPEEVVKAVEKNEHEEASQGILLDLPA